MTAGTLHSSFNMTRFVIGRLGIMVAVSCLWLGANFFTRAAEGGARPERRFAWMPTSPWQYCGGFHRGRLVTLRPTWCDTGG